MDVVTALSYGIQKEGSKKISSFERSLCHNLMCVFCVHCVTSTKLYITHMRFCMCKFCVSFVCVTSTNLLIKHTFPHAVIIRDLYAFVKQISKSHNYLKG